MSEEPSKRPDGGLQSKLTYAGAGGGGDGAGNRTAGGGTTREAEIPVSAGASLGARVLAFIIDWVILGLLYTVALGTAAILGLVTLGLLWAPLVALLPRLPIAYHTGLIASPRRATLGQSLMGLRVVSTTDTAGPGWVQALISVVLFYAGLVLTSGLILIWALFDDRGRCLHDILSGTRVVREGFGGHAN